MGALLVIQICQCFPVIIAYNPGEINVDHLFGHILHANHLMSGMDECHCPALNEVLILKCSLNEVLT